MSTPRENVMMPGRLIVLGAALFLLVGLADVTNAQTTTWVSRNIEGEPADGFSSGPAVSADGRFIAYASRATNLVLGDENGGQDIFVYDRQMGTTTRVSVTPEGGDANGLSEAPALSWNGRYVAFASEASNLGVEDRNGRKDIYVYDRETNTITRVSVTPEGGDPNEESRNPA